jgi:hypothetical protein
VVDFVGKVSLGAWTLGGSKEGDQARGDVIA